ncbi:MAG TPA: L,D-transpeptidase [Pyrinomonadaceae bacterium]
MSFLSCFDQRFAAGEFPRSRAITLSLAILLAISVAACKRANRTSDNQPNNTAQRSELNEPTIEAQPTSATEEHWQVVNSDKVTFTVAAPEAESVKIFYRPAFEDHHVVLKKLKAPDSNGKFSTELKVPADLAGDVWAEVDYGKRGKKETKRIALTTEEVPIEALAESSYQHTEDSARSDKFTGGHIEQTTLQPGEADIRITVNIPAFQLTLWQNNKEVKTYQIGIGRTEFPLPSGLRRATQIVFNPDWIPPDSSWVEDHDVIPGETIEADDPRNPLGKVKIPLGNGILVHQAARPSDLGHLVSHGCVRLLLDDLYDLSEKIIAARSLPVSKQQIEHAKSSKDRLFVKLNVPLVVDINYDTQVVERGMLHLYPDVYDHKINTVEKLREELAANGVNSANLDDNTLRQMLNRVSRSEEFLVSIADIKLGRFDTGQNQPLTVASVKKPRPNTRETRKSAH